MVRISSINCYGDILKKKQENRNRNTKGESSLRLNAEGMSVVNINETKSFSSLLNECCRKEN